MRIELSKRILNKRTCGLIKPKGFCLFLHETGLNEKPCYVIIRMHINPK